MPWLERGWTLIWLAHDTLSVPFVIIKILLLGMCPTPEPGSDSGGGRVGGGGREAAGGQGITVRGNCQSWGPSSSRQPSGIEWPLGWKTVTVALSKTNLQPWLAKGPKPMREWGNKGMTWPAIAARGRADAKESVALATEHSGLPFVMRTLTVGAQE
jgi:hypothetical protein